jgi:hypothetical protein
LRSTGVALLVFLKLAELLSYNKRIEGLLIVSNLQQCTTTSQPQKPIYEASPSKFEIFSQKKIML